MPEGRTNLYGIWRSCERFGVLPPGVKEKWEDNDWWTQVLMLEYNRGRCIEDVEIYAASQSLKI